MLCVERCGREEWRLGDRAVCALLVGPHHERYRFNKSEISENGTEMEREPAEPATMVAQRWDSLISVAG